MVSFKIPLRVLKHSLSAKNPPNRPPLLGPVKLTSAFPPNYFIYADQQVLLGESTYQELTGSRSHLKKYPVTILDFLAVLHGYRRSLEADFLYIIFLPVRPCHNVEFLLNLILLFYLLTLPRELLSIISVKFRTLKISQCYRVDPLWP